MDPLDAMALDAYLAFHTEGAWFRLYTWGSPALTAGAASDLSLIEKKMGITYLRRETGGGFLPHGHDLAFTVAEEAIRFPKEQYAFVKSLVEGFLRSLRMEPDVETPEPEGKHPFCLERLEGHEVAVGGKKIAGIAQKKRKGRYLLQGSLFVSPSPVNEGLDKITHISGWIDTDAERLLERFAQWLEREGIVAGRSDPEAILASPEYRAFKASKKEAILL